ncbi:MULTISPECIES: tetratricopeptide repeat protein [unclassified Oleiphilus]|uniref:tetratricopeptide repeat protein n=11 Tax=Oleiphilus TaxID=141450 RepID=UPI0007C387AD|nr:MULTISPECIES: tetratricopeptide repeat protein [unclassified Oleiphilus]KZY29076.1 hypothetical protein A3729_12710 [Oleiphilus sp. HI0043]KZY49902.1 hypothetical protein A3732_05125 [Oleiphilus sp. HI0050]KZY80516.1 hypothetical protein A3741_18700 [Oleiphilus sp. HI0069]KZZ68431.1 hypothetical protein A3763_01705 [Oleiphilus sp. HI0128]
MSLLRTACLLTLLFALSGCQLFDSRTYPLYGPESIASLQPAVLMIDREASLSLEISEVIENYTRLLPMLKDPETQMKVLHRLADLKLQKGELLMAEQAVDELDIAITAYLGLLEKYPDREDNDHVLYQLAKTYELKGLRDQHLKILTRIAEQYPGSNYYAEVQFRRGEILFTDELYRLAEQAFSAVILTEAPKEESPFLANAHYMQGWSLFKQAKYSLALVSYSRVLDLLLSQDSADQDKASALVANQHQTLVEDLMRVMSLSFSYLGGAESLGALFAETGQRHYEHVVYSSYADFLLNKEQFSDAVLVYKNYIARQPLSLWSPKYQMQIITVLVHAGFKKDIYPEKVRFVETYGLGSEFWQTHAPKPEPEGATDSLGYTKEQLEPLLKELADRHYVKAGQLRKAAKKRSASKQKTLDEYTLSARYNRAFTETFPNHSDLPERLVLLAESETQLSHFPEAISAFERAGYEFSEFSGRSDAAYASVLLYDDYLKSIKALPKDKLPTEQEARQALLESLSIKREQAQMRFVDIHKQDNRAVPVLYLVSSEYFDRKDYQGALPLAQRLIDWPTSFEGAPKLDKQTLLESSLIKAHSLYALNDFVLSEGAYQEVLTQMPAKDKRRAATIESLAASVFKQAEAKLADGQTLLAVDEFLRVGLVAPTSTLRASAEYDAAGYLIELKEWHRAIDVISDFRKRYPKHNLLDTLPAKMALAYRETEQWEAAAGELRIMRKLAKTEQEKQDIQFIVAELYDKADNKKEAILSYRLYANTYAEPADVYMEVTHRLAQLYKETDKPLKRRFWLAKQMKKVDSLGDAADDRMRFLAAGAASVLANDAFIQYKRIKLKLPLNETMIKKTKALEKAMKAYQKTASYGVSQFSTEAGYRMADIYAQLSRDLMDSDRPTGLNELELEQYEILLEEQAYPFEDSAIEIHEQNSSRSWIGIYDDWVQNSFDALKELLPGRYDKPELKSEIIYDLY